MLWARSSNEQSTAVAKPEDASLNLVAPTTKKLRRPRGHFQSLPTKNSTASRFFSAREWEQLPTSYLVAER